MPVKHSSFITTSSQCCIPLLVCEFLISCSTCVTVLQTLWLLSSEWRDVYKHWSWYNPLLCRTLLLVTPPPQTVYQAEPALSGTLLTSLQRLPWPTHHLPLRTQVAGHHRHLLQKTWRCLLDHWIHVHNDPVLLLYSNYLLLPHHLLTIVHQHPGVVQEGAANH